MRKLNALIALIVFVTIGGVYATWIYAGTNDIADTSKEILVTLEDYTLTGTNGTYTISSNLTLVIDQESASSHKAVLLFENTDENSEADPTVTITFTPSTSAPKEVKENGVASKYNFVTSTTMQYKVDSNGNYSEEGTAKDVFVFANSTAKDFEWEKHAKGDGTYYFTYSFDVAALQEEISINEFYLDTKAEYDQFKAVLGGNIFLNVTDGIHQ